MKRVIIFCACWILAAGIWADDYVAGIDTGFYKTYGISREDKTFPERNTEQNKTMLKFVRLRSVCNITAYDDQGRETTIGSAIIVMNGKSVRAATCYHVIKDAWRVKGTFIDGPTIEFTSYMKPQTSVDVALLEFQDSAEYSRAVCFALVSNAQPGDKVYTIGAPEGFKSTVAEGIISAIRNTQSLGYIIQTSAPISQGSSGGALLDERALLLGIISFQWNQGQNLNFAIANNTIIDEVKYLKAHPEAMVLFPYWRK